MTDLSELDAIRVAELIAAREVSACEVLTASLAKIHEGASLRAFLSVAGVDAMAAAREADVRAAAGTGGPLNGVPVAVKDLNDVRGLPTSFGLAAYRDAIALADCAMVARLRGAGAVIVGKTNTPALGTLGETKNLLGSDCANPWATDRTPGGSSGGSAVAVATGMVPVATGTDSAGSITAPAAMCGIFGFKPTHGRVSTFPAGASLGLFNALGPLSRTVADAALMLAAMAGPDPRDSVCLREEPPPFLAAVASVAESDKPLSGLRIAWSPDLGHYAVDPELLSIVSRALPLLESLGARVVADQPLLPDPFETYLPLCAADTRLALRGVSTAAGAELLAESVEELAAYPDVPASDFALVLSQLWEIRSTVQTFFDEYELMVMPATAVPAFPLREPPARIGDSSVLPGWATAMPFPALWNMTGQPAASVPCGLTAEGFPVSLLIVGRRGAECDVLRAAAALEIAAPWSQRQPPALRSFQGARG